MENDILKHRMAVISNIEKSFGEEIIEKGFEDEVNPFERLEWENSLTKAELDEFEKAKHQDGDMHPNGKWVWRQSANGGKGDWRVANPKRGGGARKTATAAPAATVKTDDKKAADWLKNNTAEYADWLIYGEDGYMYDKKNEAAFKQLEKMGWKLSDERFDSDGVDEADEYVKKMEDRGYEVMQVDDGSDTYSYLLRKKSGSPAATKNSTNTNVKSNDAKSQSKSIYGSNGYMSQDFLSYLEKNKEKIWPGVDFSEYTDIKVGHRGSKDSNYVAISGQNKNGSRVTIDDAYITGEGTNVGAQQVRKNPVIKELTEKYKKGDTSNAKKDTTSSNNVNKLKLNGVDITVKRDPKDKYGYIVEGNGKSVKTQDPSFYNVTKLTGLTKKAIADMLDIPLKTTKKKANDKKSYEAKEADAYDKGDGKIGNYPKPTVNVGKQARQLYNLLDKNRHFRFKYGMPSDEIMKKLKTYQGNVVYSYHDNAGTDEIYRIEFK